MVEPLLQELAREYNLNIVKIDVDKNIQKQQRYNVRALPTLILLDESETELARSIGTALTEIKKRLQRI